MPADAYRCSTRSRDAGEPMYGTGSTVRRWVLLEHPGPWGERALLDARLPDGLGRELRRLERRTGVRTLLIRRTDRDVEASGTCFTISSGPDRPRIERTRLDAPRDVLGLDLAALAAGRSPGLEPYVEPLFLVCTHGRHDPCCAERGRPLALALSEADPEPTWECSHVGGDRFAANVVAFPHGWYFGRVEPEAAPAVARAYREGRVDLDHARGRSCFATDVQAAELFLRRERGLVGVDHIAVERIDRVSDETVVVFATPLGGADVRVRRSAAAPARLTCHADDERSAPEFALVALSNRR